MSNKRDLRPAQVEVIKRVTDAINAGKTDIFIQAPTGTGKGLIGLELSSLNSSYILTSEKSLQKQYEEDASPMKFNFKDCASICGMDTYKCNINHEKFSLGVCKSIGLKNAEARELPCAATCEYIQRWDKASQSKQTVMNYSYYFIQMNSVLKLIGAMAPFQRRHTVICDEAHKLPELIENHFAVPVGNRIIKTIQDHSHYFSKIGATKINELTYNLDKSIHRVLSGNIDVASSNIANLKSLGVAFRLLIEEITPPLEREIKKHKLGNDNSAAALKKLNSKMPKDLKRARAIANSLVERNNKIHDYIKVITEDDCVVEQLDDGSRSYRNLNDEFLFNNHFKDFSQVRVYMSATLQPELLIKRFGLDVDTCGVIKIKSSWDHSKSPIILRNVADMSYKNHYNGLLQCIYEIDRILDEHPNERGVIHTTTNQITNDILRKLKNKHRLVSYDDTGEKMSILESFDSAAKNAVIIGPSLTTGIDMRDDMARFNIIIKLSYPSLASSLWKRRLKTKPHIYIGETASVLEQAAGRTTRSATDYSTTYILDSRAGKFISENRVLFSHQFKSRIKV